MVEGGAGEFPLVLEVEKEVEDLAGVEFWQLRFWEVVSEL